MPARGRPERLQAGAVAVDRLLRGPDGRRLTGENPADKVARGPEGRVHRVSSTRIDRARARRRRCVAKPVRTPSATTSSSSPGRIPSSASSRRSFGTLSETRTTGRGRRGAECRARRSRARRPFRRRQGSGRRAGRGSARRAWRRCAPRALRRERARALPPRRAHGPRNPELLHQIRLEQAVVAQDFEGHLAPVVRQPDAAVRDVGDVAEHRELLDHGRDGGRADLEPLGESRGRGDPVAFSEHVDRLRIVLDRGRQHRGRSLTMLKLVLVETEGVRLGARRRELRRRIDTDAYASGGYRRRQGVRGSPPPWVGAVGQERGDRSPDPGRVEAVESAVLGTGAVATKLFVGDAEGEQPVRAVHERRGDFGRRGAGQVRLDEDDVLSRAAQRAARQASKGRTVARYATDTSRSAVAVEHRVEGRPDGDDERRALAAGAHDHAARRPRGRVAFTSSDSRMYTFRPCSRAAAQKRSTSSGCPGTWIVQPGSVSSSATSPGAWCVRPARGAVVRGARADQHRADALVDEVELDLLERPLDEERRVGVRRTAASPSAPARRRRRPSAARGCPTLTTRRGAAAGELARLRSRRGRRPRAGPSSSSSAATSSKRSPHRRSLGHHLGRRRDDDGAVPLRAAAESAASSASWSRPSTVAAAPALELEPRGDAAGPAVRGGVVVDDDGCQALRGRRAGEADRLVVAALVELGVADQAHHPRAVAAPAPAARAHCRPRAADRARASRWRSRRRARAAGRGGGRAASRTSRSRPASSTGKNPLAASTA